MKKSFLLSFFLLAFGATFAQWTSPGDGSSFHLSDLVQISDGCVTRDVDGTYHINSDLTIAPNDKLILSDYDAFAGGYFQIDCHADITIQGSISCMEDARGDVEFHVEDDTCHILLDHCTDSCKFYGATFIGFSGIKMIESPVTFFFCSFLSFNTSYTSGAVNYMNCSPEFWLCDFEGNEGAAISSGANVTGSPQIYYCTFRANVLSNQNQPQINLGPGADDTIRIVENYIDNAEDLPLRGRPLSMVGGIAVSDLMQTGSTKVLVKDNLITGHRYGYTQQGYTIDALLVGNTIFDNNAGDDPMSGGSGVSIYGYSSNCKVKMRDNEIYDNYWGVTAIYVYDIDMGTLDDYGHNSIYGNHNSGYGSDEEYALYVNGSNDITAIGNYWGGPDEAYAESVIYHRPDLGDFYGLVTYAPVLPQNPTGVSAMETHGFTVYPNPANDLIAIETPYYDVSTREYRITNLTGQTLLTGLLPAETHQINVSSLPAGLYFLTIGNVSTKLMIRH